MPLVPFFQCGIVSMSCISFFSQFSALWPLYISSFPLCVNTLFHLLFLFALPALLPSPHIFCSLHQYLLFSHYLQRGILCWSCCLSRAQLGLLPPSLPLVLHLSPPCHYGEESVGSPLALSRGTWSLSSALAASRAVWPEWVHSPGQEGRCPCSWRERSSSNDIKDKDWVVTRAMKLWNTYILQLLHRQNIYY